MSSMYVLQSCHPVNLMNHLMTKWSPQKCEKEYNPKEIYLILKFYSGFVIISIIFLLVVPCTLLTIFESPFCSPWRWKYELNAGFPIL